MIWPCSPPWKEGRWEALRRSAVAGLAMTALSQVSLVIGFGSSCSQPLFENRPSRTEGSLRKETSKPVGAIADWGLRIAESIVDWLVDWIVDWIVDGATLTVFGANAVSGTMPSCSHRRHAASNSGEAVLWTSACACA